MGLTKQYLRYSPAGNANIITSSTCNTVFVTLEGQDGRFVATGACEHIIIWDLRLGEKAQVLSGEKVNVTYLSASPNKNILAAGYADGTVKTFHLRTGELINTFVGHRSQITCLEFDSLGQRLASGSKDTDIIVWDVIAESGICRLVGHKNVVTQVAFMKEHNVLISSSSDTLIKFWDLDTEHNFKTLTGHRTEVWSFVLVKNDKYLISGCNDNVLYVWNLYTKTDGKTSSADNSLYLDDCDDDGSNYPLRCRRVESIQRNSKSRVTSLRTDITGQTILCQGKNNIYDLFYLLPDDMVSEKTSKRIKKATKKTPTQSVSKEVILRDEIIKLPNLEVSAIGKSADLVMGRNNELRICVSLNNNSVELYSLTSIQKNAEVTKLRSITAQGHRTDVRAVAFSSDNQSFITVSGDSIKLWNRATLACCCTVECGYALSVTFVPGDRHVIVGLKNGHILIVDISSGHILEDIAAHEKEVHSLCMFPDLKGVVSGSGDKTAKFWLFQLVKDSESQNKVLSLYHSRTLKLDEGILCVKISPNNRFVAVSLLDSTVKIFFLDSFKFFISLYGHKLPVLCMDISSDSTLIATGSGDRNIKIWGMDFGDCHKSMFAHDDSVTSIVFVPRTHYFFSCGRDGKVKEWDADTYTKIVSLQGHLGEAYNCTVSPSGEYVLSCGSDRVLRMFKKTSEILVLEDEVEQEREEAENAQLAEETSAVKGRKQQALPSRKCVTSEKGAESIMECMDVMKQYLEQCATVKESESLPTLPLLVQAYKCNNVYDYILEVVQRIRASDLEEALMLLPYSTVCDIILVLPTLFKDNYKIELKTRLTLTIVQMYHSQIINNNELMSIIAKVEKLLVKGLTDLVDKTGYNLYGLSYNQRIIEEVEGIRLFKDASINKKKKNKVKANKQRALKRAIMTL